MRRRSVVVLALGVLLVGGCGFGGGGKRANEDVSGDVRAALEVLPWVRRVSTPHGYGFTELILIVDVDVDPEEAHACSVLAEQAELLAARALAGLRSDGRLILQVARLKGEEREECASEFSGHTFDEICAAHGLERRR